VLPRDGRTVWHIRRRGIDVGLGGIVRGDCELRKPANAGTWSAYGSRRLRAGYLAIDIRGGYAAVGSGPGHRLNRCISGDAGFEDILGSGFAGGSGDIGVFLRCFGACCHFGLLHPRPPRDACGSGGCAALRVGAKKLKITTAYSTSTTLPQVLGG